MGNCYCRLANFTIPQSQRRSEEEMYHNMTIEEFQQKAPFLNW